MKWNYFAWHSGEAAEEHVYLSALCNELLHSDQPLAVACKSTYCYKSWILKQRKLLFKLYLTAIWCGLPFILPAYWRKYQLNSSFHVSFWLAWQWSHEIWLKALVWFCHRAGRCSSHLPLIANWYTGEPAVTVSSQDAF